MIPTSFFPNSYHPCINHVPSDITLKMLSKRNKEKKHRGPKNIFSLTLELVILLM